MLWIKSILLLLITLTLGIFRLLVSDFGSSFTKKHISVYKYNPCTEQSKEMCPLKKKTSIDQVFITKLYSGSLFSSLCSRVFPQCTSKFSNYFSN